MTAGEVLTFWLAVGPGSVLLRVVCLTCPLAWYGFRTVFGRGVRRRGCADLVAGLPWFPGHAALYIVEGCTH